VRLEPERLEDGGDVVFWTEEKVSKQLLLSPATDSARHQRVRAEGVFCRRREVSVEGEELEAELQDVDDDL